ncbi:Vgb family protein [Dictyobacter formicarum]|nr:SMP-30/gluconolactonase/LRE family protein [Dictyobacter formicarum]
MSRHLYQRSATAVIRVFLSGLLLVLAACTSTATTGHSHIGITPTAKVAQSPVPRPTPTPRNRAAPSSYTAQVILQGQGHPDDLALDRQGRLLFSDDTSGTINRVNSNGSVTVLLRDPAGPEGIVVLADGTILFGEQNTNRIMKLAPGAQTATVVRALPGHDSLATCKHGVDGIAFDPGTNTLIVPDSPIGNVYRMSLDGKTLRLLATGIARPVGASVDSNGDIFVADECGGAIWKITPSGTVTRIGGFAMPDDVIPDGNGNLLVVDLAQAVHAFIRFNPSTGKKEILDSRRYIEPQGILSDSSGHIYVSDDAANVIVKYTPVS